VIEAFRFLMSVIIGVCGGVLVYAQTGSNTLGVITTVVVAGILGWFSVKEERY